MKKTIFFIIGLFIFGTSCQKNAVEQTAFKVESSSNLPPGIIPSDIKLHQFLSNPSRNTIKELDDYYRKEVLVKHKSDSYFNNLRKTVIFSLVNQYKLIETGDVRTIDFYAAELMTIDLPDPDVFLKVYNSLKGRWPQDQICNFAKKKYFDTQVYIQKNFSDPQAFKAEQGAGYERILNFYQELSK